MTKEPTVDESAAYADETAIRWFDKGSKADENFVIDAWLSTAMAADEIGPLPMNIAKDAYFRAIKKWILEDRGFEVRIAYSRAIPDEYLGFIVTYTTPRHGKLLMYVYVKSKYQTKVSGRDRLTTFHVKTRRGVCSLLMRAAGFEPGEPYVYCFKTWNWHLVTKHSKRWAIGTYNPKPAKYDESNFKGEKSDG